MKILLALVLLVLALVAAPLLFRPDAPAPVADLPWQVEPLPEGRSRVFGLTVGRSTMEEARARLGHDAQLAVVAAPGEAGSLEAYYERITLGFVTGRLVLTADLPEPTVRRLRERASRTRYMESSTKKSTLHPDDLPLAAGAPIRAITFIPSANLDEAVVIERFGRPAERIRSAPRVEHFLYPEKGLDLALDSEGKEVLQYVAPSQFARLRDPLLAGAR